MSGSPSEVPRREVTFTVNGKICTVLVYPMQRLLDVLRSELALTGTKEGCGEGECGSCSVLLNGDLVNSCLIPILQVQGATVCTIEGVGEGVTESMGKDGLHPVQRAFLECGGAQCGVCTPGMILASIRLLQIHPNPSPEQIREGLGGNLCRCTGYTRIFHAVREAAQNGMTQEVEVATTAPDREL